MTAFTFPALGEAGARFQTRENLEAEVRRVLEQERAQRQSGDEGLQSDIQSLATGRRIVGEWDASSGAFPTTRPDGSAIQPGDTWLVSTASTVDGVSFAAIDQLIAIGNGGATYAGNWLKWLDGGLNTAQVTPTGGSPGTLADHLVAGGLVASTFPNIQAAVAAALSSGDPVWLDGSIAATGNIPNLHDVRLVGSGAITRGGETFYATPAGAQTNIFYVASDGLAANDGLSSDLPTTIAQAFARMKALGARAANGRWRIQMAAGTYDDNGLTLEELPAFTQPLEIFGADVDETASAAPTTIWDGATSTPAYALRLDSSQYPSATAHLFFKNIRFQNWTSGGIVIWAHGNVVTHNVHFADQPIGLWGRHGYFKTLYGLCHTCTTWGVGVQYGGTLNCGSLTAGEGVTFTDCAVGVNVGRFTVGYVQGCVFSGCDQNVKTEWLARARTQGNTFGIPTYASITSNGNSLLTDDNGGGAPNTFPALTEAIPYARTFGGSVNHAISRYSQKTLHNYSGNTLETGATPVTIFPVTTTDKILLSDESFGGSDFVPFRLPAHTLYSPTFELEVDIGIAIDVNGGGTLALHGQGDSASTEICTVTIPTSGSFRRGRLKLRVINRPNTTTARFEAHYPPGDFYLEDDTNNLNNEFIRSNSDEQLLFRLYWTSATVDQVQFYSMRSYVYE